MPGKRSEPHQPSAASAAAGRPRVRGRLAMLFLAAALIVGAGLLWMPRQVSTTDASAALTSAPRLVRLASFGDQLPSPEVQHVAHWARDSNDHQDKAFVVVDKKEAKVWVFDARGTLVASSPALLGAAVGDDAVPGIGEKPLSLVLPEEKTTPAGRYVAEPGINATGEDIVWVSYDLAVSMHRVRPTVQAEKRLDRLASPTAEDNRISFGCINLPVAFYDDVVSPIARVGAIVYVLPETRTPQQQFGSYEIGPAHVAELNRGAIVK